MKYDDLEPGQWTMPYMNGYRIMCCDCGQVHDVNFRVLTVDGEPRVEMQFFYNARATAAARRGKPGPAGNETNDPCGKS